MSQPETAPATEPTATEFLVRWEIDTEATSFAQAAAHTWVKHFGRTDAGPDDACIFTVIHPKTKLEVTIDLSEHDLNQLLD